MTARSPRPPIARTLVSALALLLSACGGGGGAGGQSGGQTGGGQVGGGTPLPPPVAANCSLSDRQAWARSVIDEWYLYPETVPGTLSPAGFTSVQAYIDALTATARAQGRDRFFTFVTSIAEENAFFAQGTTAGFGIRLQSDPVARRVTIIEAYEGAPALAAGLDRGDRIEAIGTGPTSLTPVEDLFARGGAAAITDALGPNTAGLARTLRVSGPTGTRTVSVTKASFDIPPVSSRYGVQILSDGGRQVGYLNLRTFISSADAPLRQAFARFRAAGVTDLVIDLRYNGGGLLSIAELFGDLLGRNRFAADVFGQTVYRPEKAANNRTRRFQTVAESVAPTRIAFITTGSSASASEVVINAMIPYLGANMALVGANSFGKPVGQIALDRAACDDRLRVLAFSTRNAAGSDNYFSGLAGVVPNSCQAADDTALPLGDRNEASLRAALDFIAGRPCTPIPTGQQARSLGTTRTAPEPLLPANPSAAQLELPGLF
ncbi:peptidase S41 [Sphingomonas changnyeongensis]|uniref:Peptidase S41 n=1 Tax=Sphingomonas changnyeongensis TaxID=2698679 RepID=A0A7Z2NVW0_9SPHN|nr:S41 family peptidase [Sphingomonas changnyeongensis]QHL90214.1 peptidase S41 [Sphingomonas changnyeongensis]